MNARQIVIDAHTAFCDSACSRLANAIDEGRITLAEANAAVDGLMDDGLHNAWCDWADDFAWDHS